MMFFTSMRFHLTILLFSIAMIRLNAQFMPLTDVVQDTGTPLYMIEDSSVIRIQEQKAQIAAQMNAAELTYFVLRLQENKFGYFIFIDGRMYIEQKSIPAVPGHNGFTTKEDAEIIAPLVIEKIRQGEMPPAISVKELTALGVIRQP